MSPEKLFHGSSVKIEGNLKPILNITTEDHIHNAAGVFGTERIDIAALFMFPLNILASVGFEQDISYICIWGSREEYENKQKTKEGFIYVLPSDGFEKVGKDYEWISNKEVTPIETKIFQSVLEGMMECSVQVYFINDEKVFDQIVTNKENRAEILKTQVSENQKDNLNIKLFK